MKDNLQKKDFMKPSFTTQIEHTINFFTSPELASMGFLGLRDTFIVNFHKYYEGEEDLNFVVQDGHPKMKLHFRQISPERLSDTDEKLLNSFSAKEEVSGSDIGLVLQYLVNKNILPPGNFVVTFIEFR